MGRPITFQLLIGSILLLFADEGPAGICLLYFSQNIATFGRIAFHSRSRRMIALGLILILVQIFFCMKLFFALTLDTFELLLRNNFIPAVFVFFLEGATVDEAMAKRAGFWIFLINWAILSAGMIAFARLKAEHHLQFAIIALVALCKGLSQLAPTLRENRKRTPFGHAAYGVLVLIMLFGFYHTIGSERPSVDYAGALERALTTGDSEQAIALLQLTNPSGQIVVAHQVDGTPAIELALQSQLPQVRKAAIRTYEVWMINAVDRDPSDRDDLERRYKSHMTPLLSDPVSRIQELAREAYENPKGYSGWRSPF